MESESEFPDTLDWCDHASLVWLAHWEFPGEPEVWCGECHLADQFPRSWSTIVDFQIQVKVGGSSMVHLGDVL